MSSRGGRGGGGGRGRGDAISPRGNRGGSRGGGFSARGGRGGGGGGEMQVYRPIDGSKAELNPKISELENKLQSAVSSSDTFGLEKLQINSGFPSRPGYGTRGQNVVLFANYFELLPDPKLPIHRYDIVVKPTPETKRKLWQVVSLLLQQQPFAEDRKSIVTDYGKFLIAPKKLNYRGQEITILYKNEGEDTPAPSATVYKVSLLQPSTFEMGTLIDYISSTKASTEVERADYLQLLNIWLGHHAKWTPDLVSIGGSKAVSLSRQTPTWDLGAGLIAWRGFFSSVRVAASRILVNVNVSHRVFWEPGRLDVVYDKYSQSVRSKIDQQGALRGIRVRTTHLPERKNKKGDVIPKIKTLWAFAQLRDGKNPKKPLANPPKVSKIAGGPKDVQFFLNSKPDAPKGKENVPKTQPKKPESSGSGGKYISVFDYFRQTYPAVKLNPALPVVNVGNGDNPNYLPMEVCVVTEGQSAGIVLPPRQTQEMIKFAVRKPWENFNSIIKDGVPTVGLFTEGNPQMNAFHIQVPRKFVTVPGRVLPTPSVRYRDERDPKRNKDLQTKFGSWNMIGIKFTTGATLRQWAVLVISTAYNKRSWEFPNPQGVKDCITEFRQTLIKSGMTINEPYGGGMPQRIAISSPQDPLIEQKIETAPGDRNQARLLLIIIPDAEIPLYRHIKKVADVKHGVHTNVVVAKKLADKGAQYAANVGLKENLKLGGVNQTLPNLSAMINEDKTMIVGADVTHPSPTSAKTAPSVAGMVASIDRWLGQWPGELRVQEKRKEMITDIGMMLKHRLTLWQKKSNHANPPENILMYRDGVSEGQYKTVLEEELTAMRKACREVYPPQATAKGFPRFTIIIVGKRHHTRFTVTQPGDADRSHNPKPGTVVDRGVTENPQHLWSFFLQAHAALQGTARPANYVVIHDEIFRARPLPPGFKNVADVVEDLTHNMCYTFGRATKAVSICPPAYYADILCERARCYSSAFEQASLGGSQVSGAGGADLKQEDVEPHALLRDTMWYV